MKNAWIIGTMGLLMTTGCDFPTFDAKNKVVNVRILATRADKPFAAPGDTVHLEMLAFDARKNKAFPMRVFWIPTVCTDPPGGAPYQCYPAFADAFPRGRDLTTLLPEGPTFSFQVPEVSLDPSMSPGPANGPFFKTAFIFHMACAGHIEYVGARGRGPQAVPFSCFDAEHHELGNDDFMFAFARVFVVPPILANTNPILEHLTFDGADVDLNEGITMNHCTSPETEQCPAKPLDIVVPETSQESDPNYVTVDGAPGRERVFVDYYLTGGEVTPSLTLYDPETGKVKATDGELEAPRAASEETLFAVVRDNRGGIAWLQVPFHIR